MVTPITCTCPLLISVRVQGIHGCDSDLGDANAVAWPQDNQAFTYYRLYYLDFFLRRLLIRQSSARPGSSIA